MNLLKNLTFLFLTLGFITSCSNSESSNSKKSKADKQISSELGQIERAFDKGDLNTACDLQIKLSQDLLNYEKISPELLKSVREFQLKCGRRSFSIDLGKDK